MDNGSSKLIIENTLISVLQTAKQEGLIEMLRKSYLDVRLMDRKKSEQITRLHSVINTQKCSLDKCQVSKVHQKDNLFYRDLKNHWWFRGKDRWGIILRSSLKGRN